MRFTRAAKVAAFPLLALVLVVALIACQGPVGKAGKDGTVGTTGTTGAAAPPGLDAAAVDTLIFDTRETMGKTMMVPLAGAFTGGTGDLTYRISSAINIIDTVTYALTKSDDGADMLSVTMPGSVNDGVPEDMVILVEATDSAKPPADDVAYISVRANDVPGVPAGTTTVIVGTQDAESRTRAPATAADYHSDLNVVCAMKNNCKVTLVATDSNLRDVLRWMVYVTATGTAADATDIADTNNDTISASGTKGAGQLDGVVTIKGLKAGTATVRVWAVDDSGVPVNIPDAPEAGGVTPVDDSRPWPAAFHTISVTVDPEPVLSEDAIDDVTVDIGGIEVVGQVFDLGTPPEEFTDIVVVTPAYPSGQGIAEVTLLAAKLGVPGRTLQVQGRNSGTVTITVRVVEMSASDSSPDQWVEHEFTATVRQLPNS